VRHTEIDYIPNCGEEVDRNKSEGIVSREKESVLIIQCIAPQIDDLEEVRDREGGGGREKQQG
jgi:hypothetical protein